MRVPPSFRYLAIAALVVVVVAAVETAGTILPASRAFSFGTNGHGELGRGNLSPFETTPLPVGAVTTMGLSSIDGGVHTSIALGTGGTVLTWGQNISALGYTVSAPQTKPRQVSGLGGAAAAVSMGSDHALALLTNGTIVSWGAANMNQLGRAGSAFPAAVPIGNNFVAVSAGHSYSLALDANGVVHGWGLNSSGQLADSSPSQAVRTVEGLQGIVAIAAGEAHSLALAGDGTVYAWGANESGQSGQGSHPMFTPTPVAGLTDVIAIAAGGNFSLALRQDGTVWAWGQGALLGSNAAAGPTPAPAQVRFSDNTPLSNIVSIAAGSSFSLALRDDGRWAAWGANQFGQLGLGSTAPALGFAQLASPTAQPAAGVGAGWSHGFAWFSDPPVQGAFNASPSTSCATTITPTLNLEGLSLTGLGNADIMLTLDESGSISASEFHSLKQFATNFVNTLDIGPTRVGIVMFDDTSRLVLPPSSNKSQILSAIAALSQGGGSTCIGCGLNQADAALDASPRGATVGRIIVVVTDGANNRPTTGLGAAAHLAAAITAAHAANTVVAVGIGDGVVLSELDAIASDVSGVQTMFTTPNYASLDLLIDSLVAAITIPGATSVRLILEFAPAWELLFVSPSKSGTSVTRNGNLVTWNIPALDHRGIGLLLRLKSLTGGSQPLLSAVTYTDAQGHSAQIENASVDVRGCVASISLAPQASSGLIDTPHTVTATLVDDFGTRLSNVDVSFDVVSGPNAGTIGGGLTNAIGEISRQYTSAAAGTDVIEARLTADPLVRSSAVTREWTLPNQPPVADAGPDRTVELNGSELVDVVLSGAGSSDDGLGAPLTFSWANGFFQTTSDYQVQLSRGVHQIKLVVSDGQFFTEDFVTVTVVDPSAPIVSGQVNGALGSNGWYTSDVAVTWDVADPESHTLNTSGCDATLATVDTASQSVVCRATNDSGAETIATVSFKRDATPPGVITSPDLTASATSAEGAVVEYADASASDATSGLAGSAACAPLSGSLFAIGDTTVTCSATDGAGNIGRAAFVVTVRDTTPPSVVPSVTGLLGADGWYRGPVLVSFSVADAESAIVSSSGCEPVTLSADTAGQILTCSASSQGGTNSAGVSVKLDQTAPALTTSGNVSVDATTGSGVAVSYAPPSATDAMSGLAGPPSCAPASGTIFPLGATIVTCGAIDNAGNTAAASFTVTVAAPGSGSTEPGRMHGQGHVMVGTDKLAFDFSVLEELKKGERGKVDIRVKQGRNGRWDDDRFDARTVSAVRFVNSPDYVPGKNPKAGIDTVVFAGSGQWDKRDGYSYVVTASDRGEPGRGIDTFTIEVRTAAGQLVFSGGGVIADGNVQSTRVRR